LPGLPSRLLTSNSRIFIISLKKIYILIDQWATIERRYVINIYFSPPWVMCEEDTWSTLASCFFGGMNLIRVFSWRNWAHKAIEWWRDDALTLFCMYYGSVCVVKHQLINFGRPSPNWRSRLPLVGGKSTENIANG